MTRISPNEFRSLPLEVHAILHDVPLHDVSAVDLPGGGDGRTIAEVQSVIGQERLMQANAVVSALFRLRRIVGATLGWDAETAAARPELYTHRLPEGLRARSKVAPGTPEGMFITVYQLDREALAEIRNATAHAFLCSVLQPRGDGYRLYWAVYVKPVSWFTPIYMAAIEPFRRFIVYPAILGRIRRAWMAAYKSE
jgi:hypothetical protein